MSHKHGKRTHYIFGRIYFYFSFVYFGCVFNETIIPLAFVEYVMIVANSALRSSLAIYRIISNVRAWNNGSL